MTHKSLFILGRQPAIGRAELESLYGADTVEPIGEHAIACTLSPDEVQFGRLGGAVRLAKPLAVLDTIKWADVARYIAEQLPSYLDYVPSEGKCKLGLSVFGLPVSPGQLFATGLTLKKVCKKAGHSARVVPGEALELSSAQVLHNQLTSELGFEFLCIRYNNKTYLAQTIAVQDITAYARRDQGRPKRDARVGMLPPKLAQTIINLATGSQPPGDDHSILDPFCGTGVVLQEALLMGYGAYGSDLEPRMIDYSKQNIDWLRTGHNTILEAGDATTHHWVHPFTAVASETYLGSPLSSWPGPEKLQTIIGTCNVIVEHFLTNMWAQIPHGTRLCLAVPAWLAPNHRVHHLPLLDRLDDLGYNQVSFLYAGRGEMIYHRPDQLVARELLVITRK